MSKKTVLPVPEPVTLGQLRSVIPKHCFERSGIVSLGYTAKNVAVVGFLFYIASYIDCIPLIAVRFLLWLAYFWFQGAYMTGIWVIAHECGHQSFSTSEILNDSIGCVLHTMLLVPYWSWKYSHAKHHSNTDSMERDPVFVPKRKNEITNHNPSALSRIKGLFVMLTVGWILYLFFDATGPQSHSGNGWVSHFNPFCKLFVNRRQRLGVIASDIALLVWCWILYRLCEQLSLTTMIKYYFIPYMIVNFWLVTITFLQHTDTSVPRYSKDSWTWLRGALGTVDRDYGIYNTIHHHIADTHVLHHIFSKIPHYHAMEATDALRKSGLISQYYLRDNTKWYKALWRSYRECRFVCDEPIAWFQSAKSIHSEPNTVSTRKVL